MLRTETFGKYLNTGKKAVVRYWEHYSIPYAIFMKAYVPIPQVNIARNIIQIYSGSNRSADTSFHNIWIQIMINCGYYFNKNEEQIFLLYFNGVQAGNK